MRAVVAISALISVRLVATAMADPAISDASGQWFCQPDDPRQPQIQIDFIEDAYRRCDQHICSIYDLEPVERAGARVRISFGGIGVIEAAPDGAYYAETVTVGSTRIVNRGTCTFRSLDELHLENTQAAIPERERL